MCHLILFLPLFGPAVILIWPLSMAVPVYGLIFILSLASYVLIIKAMGQPDDRVWVKGIDGLRLKVSPATDLAKSAMKN